MTTTTDKERMAALPELPRHSAQMLIPGRKGDPERLYTAEQMYAFRAEEIAELEKENAELRQQLVGSRPAANTGGRGDAIARSKRILALVDEYHEKPTTDTRTALRIALMNEFEADTSTGDQP
jgi:ribosomal protein L29